MIGAFPPPVHGEAAVNHSLRDCFRRAGVLVRTVDISQGALDRSLSGRARQFVRVTHGLALLTVLGLGRKLGGLYIGVSGGYGQFYAVLFVAVARLCRLKLFVHHHSYAYLRERRPLTRLLVRIGGPATTHIVLCGEMKNRLEELYPQARRVYIVSNAAFLHDGAGVARARPRHHLRMIGFLSNISRAKGIMEFLNVAARLATTHREIRAVVAGPFESPATEGAVMTVLRKTPGVEYVGPKYDTERDAFYTDIDLLLFPSRHAHEAEPLAVLEAMMHGVPVICWDRGCLRSMIGDRFGLVVADEADFVDAATTQITSWLAQPEIFRTISERIVQEVGDKTVQGAAQRQALIGMVIQAAASA